jgi:DNA-binding GntR family transcriptional regulator
MEKRAHQALGLSEQAPFIVIARLRLLHNEPRVIHRAYLDPDRFPKDFLGSHNFEKESLIHIYNQSGYEVTSRDTALTARFTNPYERTLFYTYHKDVSGRPILGSEQKLFAIDPKTRTPFVLEFLQASYLDWVYEIKNRPAP